MVYMGYNYTTQASRKLIYVKMLKRDAINRDGQNAQRWFLMP